MRFRFAPPAGVSVRVGHWLPLLPLLLVSALLLWLLRDTLIPLHQRWTAWDGAYSHGYLLVLVCTLMIVRDLLPKLHASSAHWGYVPLVLVPSWLWSVGYATQLGVLQQIALPALLVCLVLPVIGLRRLPSLLLPFALLYLAIPLWELLLPVLRSLTREVATVGLCLLEVPAYIDGFNVSLPYGTVVIAGSCAGLSYLLMGLVLASINSYHRRHSLKHRIISLALMALLALVSNWLRVFALILIAYYSQMKNPLVYDHGNFGWWIFAAVFWLYLWLIQHLPEQTAEVALTPVSPSLSATLRASPILLSTAALALALPLWLLAHSEPRSDARWNTVSPSDWLAVSAAYANDQYQPEYTGFDQPYYWQTQWSDRTWLIGQLVYFQQYQGKELITARNRIVPVDSGATNRTALRSPQGEQSGLGVLIILGQPDRLVVYGHQIGKRLALKPWAGKWTQFGEVLAGRPNVALWYATTVCRHQKCSAELAALKSHPEMVLGWVTATALY
jgi:exosortase